MRKTPEFFKRLEVKKVIEKVLGDTRTRLAPVAISATESLNDDFTSVDFSFRQFPKESPVAVKDSKGKGFIDGLFNGMYEVMSKEHPSLSKIKLVEFMVNPLMTLSKGSMGTDAQASVIFKVKVGNFGEAEFQHRSRSMIYSGFSATLEAFQFYINCERSFEKIKFILENARERNRSDTVQACLYDLSKLTEVNSYEKKQKN